MIILTASGLTLESASIEVIQIIRYPGLVGQLIFDHPAGFVLHGDEKRLIQG